MSADERLNQLEPVMAEMIINQHHFAEQQDKFAVNQDLLKSQNRELARMIFDVVVAQSDANLEIKSIKTELSEVKADVNELKADVNELKTKMTDLDTKVDMILSILRNKN